MGRRRPFGRLRHPLYCLFLEDGLTTAILAALSFLIGSVPTGLIIAKIRGIDITARGSGNIGATNVLRTVGKAAALMTLIGDMLKGAVPVLLARAAEVSVFEEGIVGLCAVTGHVFSVFLRFRGGKGVATGLGFFLAYSPQSGFFAIIIWIMTVVITRYSSLGAILSFCALPLVVFLLGSREKLPAAIILALLIVTRHKDNIGRLASGTEPKVGKKA